jgi:2,3-bisphosphoglycerate-dependent phosphoglycerate mutase
LSHISPRTELLLIRHGETDWNLARRIQGHTDIALNQTGHAQALALAAALAELHKRQPFDALYSSDLQRALQTAAPAAAALMLQIRQDARLRERHYGVLEGLDAAEQLRKFPEETRLLQARDPDYTLPGGESRNTFFARVLQALHEIAARHGGQRILVVTHGGALDGAYRAAAGLAAETRRTWPLLNASLNSVIVEHGLISLQYWGVVRHLEPPALAADADIAKP